MCDVNPRRTQSKEVRRVTTELQKALNDVKASRAADEAYELTFVALQSRNKQLEDDKAHVEMQHVEQIERLDTHLAEVGSDKCSWSFP